MFKVGTRIESNLPNSKGTVEAVTEHSFTVAMENGKKEFIERRYWTHWKLINTSVKQDSGKLRYDLLPFDAVDEVVQILNYGISKYPKPEENWRDNSKPEDIKRYKAALLRHLSELQQGRTHDKESGLHHMAHVACNSLFIIALLKKFKEYDNE